MLTGKGRFSDDVNLPGQAYMVVVRSPHAHARLVSVDVRNALASPRVLAVLTGRDLLADGLKPFPHKPFTSHPADIKMENSDGTPLFSAPQYALAIDKVRHVGEAIAMVIAETVAAAKDGAELVEVCYEELPAVTATVAAARPDAPRLWDDARSNVALDAQVGNDREGTAAGFARAAHIVKFETWIQRVTGVPMEPRAGVCEYDAATQRYTLHAGSGGAPRLKEDLAVMLNVPAKNVRVLMHDVGGNFGTRGFIYPEFCLVAWAARRVGRPVKWTCTRQEAFLTDYQGRDLAVEAELALDAEGNFLAHARFEHRQRRGAHRELLAAAEGRRDHVEHLPHAGRAGSGRAPSLSNTMMTRPYRSAGRPEVMYVMERLIDLAARECGFDRIELRRRNLLTQAELPYTNPWGMIYDSGDYHAVMEKALELGDWSGLCRAPRRGARPRQVPRHRRRQLRGHRVRRSPRARRDHRASRRPGGRRHRHHLERPGPRNELRPAAERMAGRADRQRAHHRRRHRHREDRRRHARRPRPAHGEHRHLELGQADHREGNAARRADARLRAERDPVPGRPLRQGRHGALDRPARGRGAGTRPGPARRPARAAVGVFR